jgi:hypothetical protein
MNVNETAGATCVAVAVAATCQVTRTRVVCGKQKKTMGGCLHCGKYRRIVGKGLCTTCYLNPAIWASYPVLGYRMATGQADTHRGLPLPEEPTDALPGTEEKMRVMGDRAANHRQIFHPLDAR